MKSIIFIPTNNILLGPRESWTRGVLLVCSTIKTEHLRIRILLWDTLHEGHLPGGRHSHGGQHAYGHTAILESKDTIARLKFAHRMVDNPKPQILHSTGGVIGALL